MIQHILKIIWKDRKVNSWILLELILVFCILWFCADYLYFATVRYFEPRGFDIANTYEVNIGVKDEGLVTISSDNDLQKDSLVNDIWTIYDRIKQYSEIESAAMVFHGMPYTSSMGSTGIYLDTLDGWVRYKYVTPEYFEVFRVEMEKGAVFNLESIDPKAAIISTGRDNLFLGKSPEQAHAFMIGRTGDSFDPERERKVVGVAAKIKHGDYEDYHPSAYYPLKRDDKMILVDISSSLQICVRAKSVGDKNFAEKFIDNMQAQMSVGPFYLSSVESFDKLRESYIRNYDYDNQFKSIYSISLFLIINIFLGVIGTFWFRTQSRRSEIGLRMALGATKKNIQKLFITESILLLVLASLVAAIICVNITVVDVLKDMGLPVVYREGSVPFIQYFINYGITFFFLAVITCFAIWYPAKSASDTQPSETLRAE